MYDLFVVATALDSDLNEEKKNGVSLYWDSDYDFLDDAGSQNSVYDQEEDSNGLLFIVSKFLNRIIYLLFTTFVNLDSISSFAFLSCRRG